MTPTPMMVALIVGWAVEASFFLYALTQMRAARTIPSRRAWGNVVLIGAGCILLISIMLGVEIGS